MDKTLIKKKLYHLGFSSFISQLNKVTFKKNNSINDFISHNILNNIKLYFVD